jgi:hypothetical protein
MPLTLASPTRATTARSSAVALAASIMFVALVALLHMLRADLAPRAHVLSEYALGPTGWAMTLAFLALAASFAALIFVVRPHVAGWRGVIGLVALGVAAVGATLGGLFAMDPVGTPPDLASTSARLHNLGFMLGGPGALFAITFVNWALARSPTWSGSRRMLVGTTILAWAAMIVFAVAVSMLMSNPQGGDMLIGLWNRLLVLSWIVWVIALAKPGRQ